MKKYIMLLSLLFCVVFFAHSQKIIDKEIKVDKQKVEMELSFADDILIQTWSNKTIELQASIDIDDNKYNDFYTLEVINKNGKIEIIEKVDFEGIKKVKKEKNLCNFNTNLNYTIKVPENLEFDLNTISGEIELIGCQGEMNIKTISGFIDYSIPLSHKAKIDLSTVTGDVYSNVKFDKKIPKKIKWVGTNQKLSLNGGDTDVELKTVSGDIFLRGK